MSAQLHKTERRTTSRGLAALREHGESWRRFDVRSPVPTNKDVGPHLADDDVPVGDWSGLGWWCLIRLLTIAISPTMLYLVVLVLFLREPLVVPVVEALAK